ncbi:hypothetical protein B0T14DRAFT_503534 [Immersiella caudata]|uniref:Uncharacterized protein n=1 Tax=Immersiella caudata TaxID=314043 RepID=A0AA39XDY1_9PEZI|nr:hypothetical protein B0T14DRAFT_503534 [Immersiella caudata]
MMDQLSKWHLERLSSPLVPFFGCLRSKTLSRLPRQRKFSLKGDDKLIFATVQATFKAEGGYNRDSEAGTFGEKGGASVTATFGEKGGPGFMNETTYTALAGPPTPAVVPNGPGKPVAQWLDNVKTPHQSGAPPIRSNWPVSEYASGPPPAQATPKLPQPSAPWQQDALPVGRPPLPDFLPPQPAFQRDPRYTTTTTTTSTENTDMRWG